MFSHMCFQKRKTLVRIIEKGMFQIIGNNNGRHFFFQNLQNKLNELIYYGIFIQFLLHRYIRDKIFSFLSVVQKH